MLSDASHFELVPVSTSQKDAQGCRLFEGMSVCMFVKFQCLKLSFTMSVLNSLDEEVQPSNKDTLRSERCR